MQKRLLLAAVSFVLLSGCSTILNDETQRINVASSNNQPIEGTINGQPFSGPGVVELKRARQDAIIFVQTEGCREQTLASSSVDPKFFINILSGGSLGSTTDFASGRMWQYESNILINCS